MTSLQPRASSGQRIFAKMESYRHTDYPQEGVEDLPEERLGGTPNAATPSHPDPAQPASYNASASAFPDQMSSQKRLDDDGAAIKYRQSRPGNRFKQRPKKLNKKWQQRLYWSVSRADMHLSTPLDTTC